MLGMQSLMVRDSNYIGAMLNSFMIGTAQFYLLSVISEMGLESIGTSFWYAYIIAGPLGIAASIKTHSYISKIILLTKKRPKL
tara:strand:+ start:136 stop:384 length:249 start_codon:yes stop_codon:yes gene_type:complete